MELVIDLPPGDRRGLVQEVYGLAFVAVEIFKAKVVPAFGESLRHDLGDRPVSPVIVVKQLAVNIEFRAVVGRGLKGIFLLFVNLEGRFQEKGIVVQGLVDVNEVEVVLYAYLVRLAERREVRKLSLRPVQPKLIIHDRLFFRGAGGQEENHGGRNERFLGHIDCRLFPKEKEQRGRLSAPY